MDMGWFTSIQTEKEKTISSTSQHCRHNANLSKRYGRFKISLFSFQVSGATVSCVQHGRNYGSRNQQCRTNTAHHPGFSKTTVIWIQVMPQCYIALFQTQTKDIKIRHYVLVAARPRYGIRFHPSCFYSILSFHDRFSRNRGCRQQRKDYRSA